MNKGWPFWAFESLKTIENLHINFEGILTKRFFFVENFN